MGARFDSGKRPRLGGGIANRLRLEFWRGRVAAGAFAFGLALALPALAGAASALTPPTAITGPVSAVGATSATLGGTVNPNGRATTWYFEYGTTTAYGSKTATESAGSGTSNVPVSALLGGLAAATTYHYRLVATSDAGTGRGGDGILTTSLPPGATTGSASAVGATSATLGGTVNPNGRATTWYFEYGTSIGYGSKTSDQSSGSGTSNVTVSASLSGLAAATTYHYRLVATSEAGTSRGNDQTFATRPPPTVVTGTATRTGLTSATLQGTVTPNGQATTWYFEFGQSTSYGSRTSSRSAGSGTESVSVSAGVSRLKLATTYHYRLVASNASGTTRGADQTFTTAFPPDARTGPARDIGATSAVLTGSVDPRSRPTTWYFEYGTRTSYGLKTPSRSAGSQSGDYNVLATVSGLTPGTTYHYRLVAASDAGTTSGADQSFTTAAPPRAQTGAASAIRPTSATVSGIVTGNGLTTTWYFEYGPSGSYGQRTAAGTVSATSADQTVTATLSGLSEGTGYHYRLVASSAAGTAVGGDAAFTTPLMPRTPRGSVVQCTIVGTESDDVLRGSAHKDVICGFGGNDKIVGGDGSDVIYPGAGNDLVFGGSGDDVVFGGAGRDELHGGTGRDTLDGGIERDQLFGESGDDLLFGRDGDDALVGGSGRDDLSGGRGDDTLYARDGQRDVVDGGSGRDRARVDRGRDRVRSALVF